MHNGEGMSVDPYISPPKLVSVLYENWNWWSGHTNRHRSIFFFFLCVLVNYNLYFA
jgi:hypothetical protein